PLALVRRPHGRTPAPRWLVESSFRDIKPTVRNVKPTADIGGPAPKALKPLRHLPLAQGANPFRDVERTADIARRTPSATCPSRGPDRAPAPRREANRGQRAAST